MQSYLIDRSGNFSLEEENPGGDKAVADFRRRIGEKQEEKDQGEKHSPFFGLTAAVAAATLVLALSYTGLGEQAGEFFRDLTGKEETVAVDGAGVEAVTDTPSPEPEAETPSPEADGEETGSSPAPTGTPSPSAVASKAPEEETARETAAVSREYTVQSGDTMTRICRQYYGNLARLSEICALNGIGEEDIIYPGQKIKLPQ